MTDVGIEVGWAFQYQDSKERRECYDAMRRQLSIWRNLPWGEDLFRARNDHGALTLVHSHIDLHKRSVAVYGRPVL